MTMASSRPSPAGFSVRRVTGTLGAEIEGVNLASDLDAQTVAALEAALVEHKVLFFRDQPMSRAQHLALGSRFGTLDTHWVTEGTPGFDTDEKDPEVIVIDSTPTRRIAASVWHSDVTFQEAPTLGSILRQTISPDYGGDTLWADMEAAFEGLDDATRKRLDGLTATHDWHGFRERMHQNGVDPARIADLSARFPAVTHPLIRTHPVSGRKCVYVNPVFTVRINEMSEGESATTLARLFDLPKDPQIQVRFRWRKDSVAFWDNRATQHFVIDDFFPQQRRVERVSLCGDRPF